MVVLVTGAGGFLGGAVVRALRSKGQQIVATARNAVGGAEPADMGEPAAIMELLERFKPQAIVNCAATVDFGPDALARQYPVNCLLPSLLAAWCARTGTYLVQASTLAVHGTRAAQVGPQTPLKPDTDYGTGKLLAEQMIAASGCAAAVLRFGGLFGKDGPDHLGINRSIRSARSGTIPVLMGDGQARRNYLFVEDAVVMIEYCVSQRLMGCFWAGGAETLTIAEMLQAICDVYCPGQQPEMRSGGPASDQVVAPSPELPTGRTFRLALDAER